MSDLVKQLRVVGYDAKDLMIKAADKIEELQSRPVDDKNFYHCLDKLQEYLNDGAWLHKDEDEAVCHLVDSNGDTIVSGITIRELLANLVLSS